MNATKSHDADHDATDHHDAAPSTVQSGADLERYNGYVTVRNPATDGHRTFRIQTQRRGNLNGKRIVSLLTGPNNETDYTGFGFVLDNGRVVLWKSKRDSKSYRAFADILNRPEWYEVHRGLEFLSDVRCRCCNRTLTDPESISCGMGPRCRSTNR